MGYSSKVNKLEKHLKDLDLGIGKSEEEKEKLKADYDYYHRTHMATMEDFHAKNAAQEVLFKEKEDLMGMSIEQGAEFKVFDEEGGDFISHYQESDEYGKDSASRFVDGFTYVGRQASVAYPQYEFGFEEFPLPNEVVSRMESRRRRAAH